MLEHVTRFTREEMVSFAAADIQEGWCVNLGIGLPTEVADYVPADLEIVIHSENGIVGMGPAPAADAVDPWLQNAGKKPVTLVTGGSYIHHADSFALARGGRLDLCILGAYQVSEAGDLANHSLGGDNALPSIGGAMDLAVGANRTWVLMQLFTKNGASKILKECTYPMTAVRAVERIYCDYAILDVTPRGLVARALAPGLTVAELSGAIGLPVLSASN